MINGIQPEYSRRVFNFSIKKMKDSKVEQSFFLTS
jgi:hypothetical protein